MLGRTILSLAAIAAMLNACESFARQHDFLEDRGALRTVALHPVDSTRLSITHDVVLVDDRNDTARGRIRAPRHLSARRVESSTISSVGVNANRYPVAFLTVGVETGKDVIELIEGYDASVVVFAIDYLLHSSLDFTGWNSFRSAYDFRDAGFRTIPQIALCLDWLSSLPYVDTTDVTIVAVSFGVFTGVPAAVLDRRVDRLVVVQAGGELRRIVAANADRLGFPLPSWLAGWIGSVILAPFEPNDYIEQLAPRPLLLVSGESDRFFPRESVESFYERAREPKEWIRHKSGHVMPGEEELIRELTEIVGERLYGGK